MDASAFFRVLGDGLTIVSLALIYSTTLKAWKRIPADAKIPMQWNGEGKPTWRAGKPGLLVTPMLATVLLFLPTLLRLTYHVAEPMEIVVLFAVRATGAALFCGANLYFLKRVAQTLEDEGTLEK